eukprot:271698-Alexandrium_andersonii.AAC.1
MSRPNEPGPAGRWAVRAVCAPEDHKRDIAGQSCQLPPLPACGHLTGDLSTQLDGPSGRT